MSIGIPKSASFDSTVLKNTKKTKRSFWEDPITGYNISAGGILFYDNEGVWVIGEYKKGGIEFTDIGGRYMFEDCNIYSTVRRELAEETYGLCDLNIKNIKRLFEYEKKVYVNDHLGQPSYVCIIVNLSSLPLNILKDIDLNPELFLENRKDAIKENPDAPKWKYSSVLLTKLDWNEVYNCNLSFRLEKIISKL